MKLSKALKAVMLRWGITNYRLSQKSGVEESAISRILNGKAEGTTWINVEKIAMGLEKIDPIAKIAFAGALVLADDVLPDQDFQAILTKQNRQIKEVSKVLVALDKLNFLNRSAIDNFKAHLQERGQMTFEQFIYAQARNIKPRDIPEAENFTISADDLG